jgi:hypothetical protein
MRKQRLAPTHYEHGTCLADLLCDPARMPKTKPLILSAVRELANRTKVEWPEAEETAASFIRVRNAYVDIRRVLKRDIQECGMLDHSLPLDHPFRATYNLASALFAFLHDYNFDLMLYGEKRMSPRMARIHFRAIRGSLEGLNFDSSGKGTAYRRFYTHLQGLEAFGIDGGLSMHWFAETPDIQESDFVFALLPRVTPLKPSHPAARERWPGRRPLCGLLKTLSFETVEIIAGNGKPQVYLRSNIEILGRLIETSPRVTWRKDHNPIPPPALRPFDHQAEYALFEQETVVRLQRELAADKAALTFYLQRKAA